MILASDSPADAQPIAMSRVPRRRSIIQTGDASIPNRALQSSTQDCLTMSHNTLVNPRYIAFSGFPGQTPSVIARMTLSLPEMSWYGA